MLYSTSIFSKGPQTSQKSRSHLQIPGARGVTCCKFHTKHPQFWSDPWLSALWHFLLGACIVKHIFVCKEKRTVIMLKILVAIIHNLVTQGTGHLEFVHPWSSEMISHTTILSVRNFLRWILCCTSLLLHFTHLSLNFVSTSLAKVPPVSWYCCKTSQVLWYVWEAHQVAFLWI